MNCLRSTVANRGLLAVASLLLFTQIIGSSIAQTLELTHTRNTDNMMENRITVHCINGIGSTGIITNVMFSLSCPGESNKEIRANQHTFTVTPDNETTVICSGIINGGRVESEPVTFAGK